MVVVVKVVVRENENVGGVPSQKKYIWFMFRVSILERETGKTSRERRMGHGDSL